MRVYQELNGGGVGVGTHRCKTVLEGLRCVKGRMMLPAERVGCLLTAKEAPPNSTPPRG